jgi:pilus assembly protein CpaE
LVTNKALREIEGQEQRVMKNRAMILVAGRDKQHLNEIGGLFRDQPDLQVRIHHIENGHADPLHGMALQPDILLLVLSAAWEEELRAFQSRTASKRPAMIVIGPAGDTQVMRKAMQAGACDFFTYPAPLEELLASTLQIAKDMYSRAITERGILTAIINATNGSGGSFLACNIAQMMTIHSKLKVALIDMDLQFGNLPLYLDMNIRNNFSEALKATEQLDAVALEGYMSKHSSGLPNRCYCLGKFLKEILTALWMSPCMLMNRWLSICHGRSMR